MMYRTPAARLYKYYLTLTEPGREEHILIAGAPGSGKSVLLNGLITTVLKDSPAKTRLILIDPKRVELRPYSRLPHTLAYGDEHESIVTALRTATEEMERRLARMAKSGSKRYDGPRLYVIVDELLDLMTDPSLKKIAQPMLLKLAALGRAPQVLLVAATQCPIAAVLPTPFKACFVTRIALRTASRQDSRNIIGQAGAETLPIPRQAGKAYCIISDGITAHADEVPMYTQEQSAALIGWWMSPSCTVA